MYGALFFVFILKANIKYRPTSDCPVIILETVYYIKYNLKTIS